MKHIKKPFVSQFSQKAGQGKAHHSPSEPESLEKKVCPHNTYCNVKKFGKINCLFGFENCRTYKFYQRYGKEYNLMFV